MRAEATTRVDPTSPDKCPKDLQPNEKWIEVRISQQTLILYEGTTPIFDTLVSTGVDGTGDPETTRSTPRGAWRIHSKHITYRMAGSVSAGTWTRQKMLRLGRRCPRWSEATIP